MIKSKVGKHIKEIRQAKGYSQESFSLKCGLHRTYIAGVELGNRNISLENLNKIAQALEVSLAELCNFEEPIHNIMTLKIGNEEFILKFDCELNNEIKEEIEIIARLAYDEDEPSLDNELKKHNIDSIYDATPYDIAIAMQKEIKNSLNINPVFISSDLKVEI